MTTYNRSDYSEVTGFPEMIGKTIAEVKGGVGDDSMVLLATDGSSFRFYHQPDCCESVAVQDIVGDIADLIGSPIVEAEEISNEGAEAPEHAESYTWTFYRFSTAKGTVTVRWLGESSGYYSESVSYAYGPRGVA